MKIQISMEVGNGGVATYKTVDIPIPDDYPYLRTLIVTAIDGQSERDLVALKFNHSLRGDEHLFVKSTKLEGDD